MIFEGASLLLLSSTPLDEKRSKGDKKQISKKKNLSIQIF